MTLFVRPLLTLLHYKDVFFETQQVTLNEIDLYDIGGKMYIAQDFSAFSRWRRTLANYEVSHWLSLIGLQNR